MLVELENANDRVTQALWALFLPGRPSADVRSIVAEDWIGMTVFQLVFVALAEKHPLPDILQAFEQGLVKEWYDQSKKLLPHTIAISLNHSIVGATYAPWRNWPCLTEWEKAIRDVGFSDSARAKLDQARMKLTRVEERWQDQGD